MIYIHTHIYIYHHIYIYVYDRILFSHKKKEILPFVTTWMDFEAFMLSEISQTDRQRKKNTYDLAYMWNQKQKQKTNSW